MMKDEFDEIICDYNYLWLFLTIWQLSIKQQHVLPCQLNSNLGIITDNARN